MLLWFSGTVSQSQTGNGDRSDHGGEDDVGVGGEGVDGNEVYGGEVHASSATRCTSFEVQHTHTHACARTHFLSPLMLQLFCDAFIEDPYFVCEIAQSCLAKQEQDTNVRTNQAEKARKMCEAAANVIDVRLLISFCCPNTCRVIRN